MNADLMSTIEALNSEESQQGIHAVMLGAIENYGFATFMMAGLPDHSTETQPFVLQSSWDNEWFERYAERGYAEVDPVARNCFQTTRPFDWSAAPYDRVLDARARQVRNEARDFGMNDGLCVPIHRGGILRGVLSLVGPTDELDDNKRLELHMLALYACDRLSALYAPAKRQAAKPITPREAEVLKWVAAGKTATEIAEITGMGSRTVNQHCENAQRRLGTSNRIHTVVEAIRTRLIVV